MNLVFRTRPTRADLRHLKTIVASTGLFPRSEVAVAVGLLQQRLDRGLATGYRFVFAEVDGKAVAYACYRRDEMTRSCFELYWIATHAEWRGRGIGKALLTETSRQVEKAGGTMLVAETSGRALYAPTRAFYLSAGYTLVARLRDYYDEGDDKCIFLRRLA